MKCCELTLSTPQENLACDEALLDHCEETGADEVIRFWEPSRYFVVLGYANRIATETNLPFCEANTIPILRRCSGGGTVLQGPGCLNYSLILRILDNGPLRTITATNDFVMGRHQEVLSALLKVRVEKQGHTDLTVGGLKFAGNAQRRKLRYLIFHGCFLLDMDIGLLQKALLMPSKQPAYRAGRSHSDFLVNLKLSPQLVKSSLREAWHAAEVLSPIPLERVNRLVRDKYSRTDWNRKF